MKKSKLSTPDWVLEGYNSKSDYEKAKGLDKKKKPKKETGVGKFKVKVCSKCNSRDVGVVIGEIGIWECKKCGWKGKEIDEEEVSEGEYFKILEKMNGK